MAFWEILAGGRYLKTSSSITNSWLTNSNYRLISQNLIWWTSEVSVKNRLIIYRADGKRHVRIPSNSADCKTEGRRVGQHRKYEQEGSQGSHQEEIRPLFARCQLQDYFDDRTARKSFPPSSALWTDSKVSIWIVEERARDIFVNDPRWADRTWRDQASR